MTPTSSSREGLLQRLRPREEDVRGPYFRDQTAIIHSTSFRRLKHKTQALFAPENDHVCTRIEHVLHVATIATTVCRGLKRSGWDWLEDDLAYAAGLGHDLGHAPFGHSGERALNGLVKESLGGFRHEIQSLRMVDKLANSGTGLNLTYGVRDAILCHDGEKFEQYLDPASTLEDPWSKLRRSRQPASMEGCVVRFSDKIAYLGRDLEDALRSGLVSPADVPAQVARRLGHTNGAIINALVIDLIENSLRQGRLGFSDGCFEEVTALRDFNYQRIYRHPEILRYEKYCTVMVESLYHYFAEGLTTRGRDADQWLNSGFAPDRAFGGYLERMQPCFDAENASDARISTDYVAGMTDNYALKCYSALVLPEPLHSKEDETFLLSGR
ncbi:MAG: HD domain-containing protein [Eubacteriales bacterium]|nr:HD domain-containing protein [Eubacteriales bacterium]